VATSFQLHLCNIYIRKIVNIQRKDTATQPCLNGSRIQERWSDMVRYESHQLDSILTQPFQCPLPSFNKPQNIGDVERRRAQDGPLKDPKENPMTTTPNLQTQLPPLWEDPFSWHEQGTHCLDSMVGKWKQPRYNTQQASVSSRYHTNRPFPYPNCISHSIMGRLYQIKEKHIAPLLSFHHCGNKDKRGAKMY
jgi:hypothetical protein